MVEEGFVKADSTNLPKVDMFMVAEFIKNDERFNAAEIRLVKASLSSRETYGDNAIGYVCLQRSGTICIVKGKICPEHSVRKKNYSVKLTVDTEKEEIEDVTCEDCAASLGGCKHTLAFLMWLHRKSEEASPTEVQCYWNKPVLSSVGTTKKFIKTTEMYNKSVNDEDFPDVSEFLSTILQKANDKQIDSQLTRHNFELIAREPYKLSIHELAIQFSERGQDDVNEFLQYASSQYSDEICAKIDKETQDQSNCFLWHALRYARITASVLHEAAHCKTGDGSLVQKLLGASKKFDTIQMKRGRNLESEVLSKVQKQLKIKLEKCGILLIPNLPVFGASPDAIGKDFVCEVKCPSSVKAYDSYIKNGNICVKYKAQLHLQMLAAKMQKGLFIIADSKFEENKNIQLFWIEYDSNYINNLVPEALDFWKKHIYPKVKQ